MTIIERKKPSLNNFYTIYNIKLSYQSNSNRHQDLEGFLLKEVADIIEDMVDYLNYKNVPTSHYCWSCMTFAYHDLKGLRYKEAVDYVAKAMRSLQEIDGPISVAPTGYSCILKNDE